MNNQLKEYLNQVDKLGYSWESVVVALTKSNYPKEQIEQAKEYYFSLKSQSTFVSTNTESTAVSKTVLPLVSIKKKYLFASIGLLFIIGTGILAGWYIIHQQQSSALKRVNNELMQMQDSSSSDVQQLSQVDILAIKDSPDQVLSQVKKSFESITSYTFTQEIQNKKDINTEELAKLLANVPEEARQYTEQSLNSSFRISISGKVAQKNVTKDSQLEVTYVFDIPNRQQIEPNSNSFKTVQINDTFYIWMNSIPGQPAAAFLPSDQWLDTTGFDAGPALMGIPALQYKDFSPLVLSLDEIQITAPQSMTNTKIIDGVECLNVEYSVDDSPKEDQHAPRITVVNNLWVGIQDALPRELISVQTIDYGPTKDINETTVQFTNYNQPVEIEQPVNVTLLKQ